MENKLKVGQRINLYNVIANKMDLRSFTIGNTYVGEEREESGAVFIFTNADYDAKGMTATMYPEEVKKIGCFVVREVYSNNNPETII